MVKFLKQLLLFFVLFFVIALFSFPYSSILEEQFLSLKSMAKRQGLLLDVQELRLTSPLRVGFSSASLSFPVPPIFFPVFVTAGEIAFSPLSFPNKLDTHMDSYGGTITGEFSPVFFGEKRTLTVTADKLDVSAHPLLSSLGLSGKLGAISSITSSSRFTLPTLYAHFTTSFQGAYAGGHKINNLIPLPPVRDIDLEIRGLLDKLSLAINAFEMASSLGLVKGRGAFQLRENGNMDTGKMTLTVQLTDEGLTHVGSYLALASGNPSMVSKNWLLNVSMKSGLITELKATPQQ